jgi:PAS domain S-box-containing protein
MVPAEELIHPDDRELVKASQKIVFENSLENYWEAEFRFLKADGNYAYVYDRGYIVRDQSGNPKRMIGASRDITLQKEHLEEIERIQQNLQVVINTTEDLIWSVDQDLKIITANKAFGEFMEHLYPDTIQEGDTILSPKLDKRIADRWQGFYQRALEGEKFFLEYEVLHRKQNLWKIYNTSFSPIINNENVITGVACFARDISELKMKAIELKHSQKRFRDLFHLSPQPMWLYENETFKIVEINKAAMNHYGYSEKEFLNMTIMDIRPEEEILKTKKIIQNRRKNAVPDFNQLFRHLKRNGEIIDVQIYSTPLKIDEKNYTLVIAIDVTEKKRYEHNINKAIIKAQENERFEIGSELHDNICQLLASSKMRISLLKDYIPEERRAIFEESKDFIMTALEEIRNLSHRLAPSFFNDKTLEEAFTKLFNSFNFLKEYSIHLNFSENVRQLPLNLDLKLNLYRIMQEQLRNIVKYAKASEIDVEVRLIDSHILQMRIADNGIGFILEEVQHGIGISNMKRRAELSAGELHLKSSPGNGTEIMVLIPLEEG